MLLEALFSMNGTVCSHSNTRTEIGANDQSVYMQYSIVPIVYRSNMCVQVFSCVYHQMW